MHYAAPKNLANKISYNKKEFYAKMIKTLEIVYEV